MNKNGDAEMAFERAGWGDVFSITAHPPLEGRGVIKFCRSNGAVFIAEVGSVSRATMRRIFHLGNIELFNRKTGTWVSVNGEGDIGFEVSATVLRIGADNSVILVSSETLAVLYPGNRQKLDPKHLELDDLVAPLNCIHAPIVVNA